jgi:mannitol/fructose-specific phosphotransferase system IIA component (Ntr-type)
VQLTELFQEDVIRVGLRARDKWEAIEELVDTLVSAHEIRLADRPLVIEAVNVRERSFSTGLKYGLAIPHGTVDCVKDLIAAMGTSRGGIPFESADGAPARLVILLLIPKATFQQYVPTLAGISGIATEAGLRDAILAADTAQEVMTVLQGVPEI